MTLRRKIIAGNWKMHKTCEQADEFIRALKPLVTGRGDVDVLVCPPFTALSAARRSTAGSTIGLGAQDLFWKSQGAYTGRISAGMLTNLGVSHVIVGHSEARGRFGTPDPDMDSELMMQFGDNDASVNRKLRAALASGLVPICCVGETIDERRARRTDAVVGAQTSAALSSTDPSQVESVIFAYEPVWAIGTGEVCDSTEANRVCALIRDTVEGQFGADTASRIRIQYGGSVKPDNAVELMRQSNIDGALVGGASLHPEDFAAIVTACPGP